MARAAGWLGGVVAASAMAAGILVACGDYGPVTLATLDGGDLSNLRIRGVGEPCGDGARCRDGLVCASGTCAPGHATDENQPCTISAECKGGLYCGARRVCTRAGMGIAGTTCGSDADCASGLRCDVVGFSAECQADGAKDLGAACATPSECFGGLLCTNKTCAAPAPGTGSLPLATISWNGVDCADDTGATKAYFRVPRGQDDGDFFRLPFPNDARRKNGKPDLSGFPTPGAEVLGYDLLDRWLRYVEASADGFSAYPTMIVRFSGALDTASVQAAGAVKLMDLTSASEVAVAWAYGTARSKYVCGNALTARPAPGAPLVPGHTYALLVSNVIKANGGANLDVPADFKAVIGGADPGAPLSAAWAAYAPLRTWAAAAPLDLATLASAAVFTVGKHRDLGKSIADQVAASAAPTVTSWVKCGSAPSPCPDAQGDRACASAQDPAFDELHALVTLPVWQKGKAPYLAPEDGGDVALDGSGKPVQQGSEQVCMSLTVPKGVTMPASGWPVAIWSHGTGGSFRSAITDGVAKRLASADGGAANIAVLSIDGVAHGTRRGGSQATAVQLWNATSNPQAMRGRLLQSGGDVAALVRLASQLDVPANASPTAAEIKLGTVMILGHDQGATATALAAPYAPVKGVAVAGIGASFEDALRAKKQPVDFFDVAPVVLGETTLTPFHPALTVLQNAVDPGDPMDHAGGVVSDGKHVFAIYSQSDSFTTGPMQLAFTHPAKLGVANPPGTVGSPEDIGAPILPVPAGGNAANNTTAIVRQYAAASFEGHTIVFRDADAIRDLDRFAADVARGLVPKVGR